jgi:hypothetical protein
MIPPKDFHNKKKYLDQLTLASDFSLAESICKDYLQQEDHWFWHYAIALIYRQTNNYSVSFSHLQHALKKIEPNNYEIQKIVLSISDHYIREKKFWENKNILLEHLSKFPLYFDLAERLYTSCILETNFTIFQSYIEKLERFTSSNDDLSKYHEKINYKKFISFLIKQNELILVEKIINYNFLNMLLLADDLTFYKAQVYFDISNYEQSKKLFLQISHSKLIIYTFKYLAELFRIEGSRFKAFKYSLKHLKFFPADCSIIRTIAFMHSIKKKKHSFLKRCLSLYQTYEKNSDLNFALGKIYDDLKIYSQAIIYFQKANTIVNSTMNFKVDFFNNEINVYKNCFDFNFFSKHKNSGYPGAKPIFIVGLPRSGSTIIEELLSRHPSVEALGEVRHFKSNFKYFFNIYEPDRFLDQVQNINADKLKSIGEKYYKDIKSKLNQQLIFTDKMLFNYAYLPLLKCCFANSKIIITDRDYKDIFISIYKNYFSDPEFNFAYKEQSIVDLITLYHNTIIHWKQFMGNDLLFVNYKNLVEDPEQTFKHIYNYCELDWNSSYLDHSQSNNRFIDTASSSQARRKIYKDSLSTSAHYTNNFSPFFLELDKLIL